MEITEGHVPLSVKEFKIIKEKKLHTYIFSYVCMCVFYTPEKNRMEEKKMSNRTRMRPSFYVSLIKRSLKNNGQLC